MYENRLPGSLFVDNRATYRVIIGSFSNNIFALHFLWNVVTGTLRYVVKKKALPATKIIRTDRKYNNAGMHIFQYARFVWKTENDACIS